LSTQTYESHRARAKWRDILDITTGGETDVVVERYGKPVVVVIAYADYIAIQDQLDDMRAARRAQAIYEEWKSDPSSARPYAEFRAELVAEGALDEYNQTPLGDNPTPES
jgi:prevent-host-death family protein